MPNHHDAIINIPLAVIALATWWFLPAIELASHWVAVAIPFATALLIGLQIWWTIHKLRNR
jgi:hypothetical protein